MEPYQAFKASFHVETHGDIDLGHGLLTTANCDRPHPATVAITTIAPQLYAQPPPPQNQQHPQHNRGTTITVVPPPPISVIITKKNKVHCRRRTTTSVVAERCHLCAATMLDLFRTARCVRHHTESTMLRDSRCNITVNSGTVIIEFSNSQCP
ncbi:Hypothetical predicted protein [Olea europaea subsp. europaea]|uniref:Uncharacterized protein n=1 Tax=Olea europaea subsp. europaea TaxID=158383 RepID=A0A8S0V0R3_OLEEU|nr:Hypothetical predicted protein [Olea europaea subsp. europaea]